MPWAWKLTACCDAGEDGFSPGAYVKTHRNGLMCLLQSDAGPVSVSPSPSRMLSCAMEHLHIPQCCYLLLLFLPK